MLKAGQRDTMRFETFVPEDRDSVLDVIKVFATTELVDFYIFAQDRVRGPNEQKPLSNDPLVQLLSQATLSTTRGSRPVELGSWYTAERVFKVKR